MKDVEPEEMARRIWLSDKIRQVLWDYGFQILEPSPLENLETLEAKSGPAVREQIYWFKDKAGRNLGLRFDLTIGMTRMIANRFDLPEPIALGSDILDKVGLVQHEIRISNRKLAEGFLKSIGVQAQPDVEHILRIIDGLGKLGPDQGEGELTRAGLTKDKVKRILGFADIGGEPDKVLPDLEKRLPKEGMIKMGLEELSGTIENVEALGKLSKCKVDLRIVRGIGYYDGTVFEAYDHAGEDIGTIFGGGRFDKLCRIYGKRDMPATGVAGGIERLILSLERKDLFPKIEQRPQVFVAMVNHEVWSESVQLVQELRNHGIRTDYDLKQRPLKKQLDYADSVKALLAMIVGPRELKEGNVRLKDMKTGEEKNVKKTNLVDEIKRKLS